MRRVVKEIHCDRWFIQDWVAGITLYPYIFYNKNHPMYKEHFKTIQDWEWEHIEDIRETGFFKWYAKYILFPSFRREVEEGHNHPK